MNSVLLGLKLINENPAKREDLPVKIQLKSGELLEIEEAQFTLVNGGEIHLMAGPTEEEEEDG